ncbi:MAG: type II secretion system F family protein [Hyphomicrobiales bacterium]|nr:type II secretion system F family protein [Hyphomicrobiales bacterium]
MVDQQLLQLAVVFLAALAVGGIVYVLVFPYISGEKKAEKRRSSVATRQSASRARAANDVLSTRKKEVQETIKELEAKQKSKKKATLQVRLTRAGLNVPVRSYWLASLMLGAGVGLVVFVTGSPAVVSVAAGFAAAMGIPRWLLAYMTKRRQKKFLIEFANAIDIIVRGVKSGLPLNDCLQIIAAETPEPVKSEFEDLVEQQRVGVPLSKAFDRMYERVPLQEVNFFSIVIAIQQKVGGNLAEALGNLSQVLRERQKLHGKVQAFSAEAKSSAAIIGALPPLVMLVIYITTPDYIELLWTEQLGQVMLAGSAIWMLMGVLVMRKMINFDY